MRVGEMLGALHDGFVRGGACLLLLLSLTFDVPATNDRSTMMDPMLGGRIFDIARWMIGANIGKLAQDVLDARAGLDDAAQAEFVRDTFARIGAVQRASDEVDRIFLQGGDAQAASADARARRDALREELDRRLPLAEAILQGQIESVLRDEGFALGGQVWPPTRLKLTELPDTLIISRRDRIERIDQRILEPGIPTDELDRIERDITRRFNVSAYVSPIGGLGAYPTMLAETTSLKFTIEVGVHEWVHNYLVWRLAWVATAYLNNARAQNINETAAVLVERELAPKILRRYYPEALGGGGNARLGAAPAQARFDFNKEMRETRLRADALLAEGKIEEAESYMEQRRQLFVQNGWRIRRLNQAYFAFHGAYNAEPGGAPSSGRDPIGPAVQALFKRSAGAREFLERVAALKSDAELLAQP